MESSTVEAIAAEFVERIRGGDSPTIEEYRRRFPALAEEIGDLFPMLAKLEQLAPQLSRSDQGSSEPAAGDKVGPYQLHAELGRGGMAVVFDATDSRTGKQVAVKVMSGRMLMTQHMIDRFDREVRSASRLHHTHIVPILDSGEINDVRFLVMERIDGASLSTVLAEVGQCRSSTDASRCAAPKTVSDSTTSLYDRATDEWMKSPEFFRRVARLGAQVADAVSHAHLHGVFHRDIKPSNIILDGDGNAWVTDFGLAKTEEDNLTQTGDIVGTPRYMAPERLRGRFTPASDVFGIGATLYELITLRPAFDQTDQLALIRQIEDSRPARLNQVCAAIPSDLEIIVSKAMSKDPAERYLTAESLAEDLKRFIQGEEIRSRRPGMVKSAWKWMRKHPATAAAICGLFLILSTGLAVSTHNWRRANRFLEQSMEETARANRERQRAEKAEKMHAEVARQQENLTERARESLALIVKLQQAGEVLEPDVIEAIHAVSGDSSLDLQERLVRIRQHNAYLMMRYGRRSDALVEYQQIAEKLETRYRENPTEELAISLIGTKMLVGYVLNAMGRVDQAIEVYHESIESWGQDSKRPPSLAMRDACARVQHNLGYAYVVKGKRSDAERLYRQVIDTRRELLSKADGDFKVRQLRSLAQVYGDLAFCFQEGGRAAECLDWLGKCLLVRQELVDQSPDDSSYQDALAKAHNHLGDAHRVLTRNLFAATKNYVCGLRVRGDLTTSHPQRIEYRHHQANDYSNLGSVWAMLGDQTRAADAFQKAIDDYRVELEIDTQNAVVRKALADQQLKLGRAHFFSRDSEQSRQQFWKSLDNLHRCVSDVPGNRAFEKKLGECHDWCGSWFDRFGTAQQKRDFIEQIVKQTPDLPHVLHRAAYQLVRGGGATDRSLTLALGYAKQAKELSKDWHVAHTLGVVHLRCGNLKESEALLKESVRRAGRQSRCEPLLRYAECLHELGNSEQANRCYESALQNWLQIPYMHYWIEEDLRQIRADVRAKLKRRWVPLETLVDAHFLYQNLKLKLHWLGAVSLLPDAPAKTDELFAN